MRRDIARVKRWWKDNGVRWGFGRILSLREVEQKRKSGAAKYIAGFGAQSIAQASAIATEVAKLKQIPTFAPKGTRRLRASKGLIPDDSVFYASLPKESLEERVEREKRTRQEHFDQLDDLINAKRKSLIERVEILYQDVPEWASRPQGDEFGDDNSPDLEAAEAED